VLPRPDIAEGIFFEYLRYDDPISPDLRQKVVDGFPFLLAPLAQVKGVNLNQQPHSKETVDRENPLFRAVTNFSAFLSSHAGEVLEMAKQHLDEAASHAQNGAHLMLEGAQSFAGELNRRREEVSKHMLSLVPDAVVNIFLTEQGNEMLVSEDGDEAMNLSIENYTRKESLGSVFGYPLTR